jgi:hypothetical protein
MSNFYVEEGTGRIVVVLKDTGTSIVHRYTDDPDNIYVEEIEPFKEKYIKVVDN